VSEQTNRSIHIGEVADLTGLSLRTIRHYDEIGLVAASGRSEGGFRLYTGDDVERLLLVKQMKPLGFSLEEMIELLAVVDAVRSDGDPSTIGASRARLDEFIVLGEERRSALQRQLEKADELLGMLRRQ
jgi:DNA-binding transcriptional MerR regulator